MDISDFSHLSQIDPKNLFNSLPQALLFLSKKNTICAANTAFHKLCESNNSTIQGKLLDLVFDTSNDYRKFMEAPLDTAGILWLRQSSGNSLKVVAQRSAFLSGDEISSTLSVYAFSEEGLGSCFVAGSTHDGSWMWDMVKSTTWRSSRWLEIAGMTHEPSKMDSDKVSSMFEFINASEDRDTIKKKLNEASDLAEGEGYLKCLDGTRKHLSWQGLVVARNSKGEPILTMGSIRDMTPFMDRNVSIWQARDNAAHQARLLQLGETLATVSHELNQPLSAIASYASVLKRSMDSNAEDSRIISHIETQALRAGTLLRRIRDFAQRGGHDIRTTIPIIPILADVIEWMKTDWRCRDMRFYLSVNTELGHDDCKIKCHRVEIEQIIINLIVNAASAVRSMEAPRQLIDHHDIIIGINYLNSTKSLGITVADRGPGVNEALLETIFTPFKTTRSDGLGLGLSISRSIANELGGTLEYKHRNGGGALFILSIPMSPSDEVDSDHASL